MAKLVLAFDNGRVKCLFAVVLFTALSLRYAPYHQQIGRMAMKHIAAKMRNQST